MAIGFNPLQLSVPGPYKPYSGEHIEGEITRGTYRYYDSLPEYENVNVWASSTHTVNNSPDPYPDNLFLDSYSPPTPMEHSDFKLGMKLVVNTDNISLNGGPFQKGDVMEVISITTYEIDVNWIFRKNKKQLMKRWHISRANWEFLSPYKSFSTSHSPQTFMGSVISKVRNLTKSKSDKLYLKHGFKDQCGDWSQEARDAYIELKLNTEHEEILLPKVEEIDKEEKEESCNSCK